LGFLRRLFGLDDRELEQAAESDYARLLGELDSSDLTRTRDVVAAIREEGADTPLEPDERRALGRISDLCGVGATRRRSLG
jgi:hypothetical protein